MGLEFKKQREEPTDEVIKEEFPSFTIIEFELNGKKHKIDVAPLLRVSNEGLESAPDKVIDEHLEGLSVFRFSVATLKELVSNEYTKASQDFDRWTNKKWKDAYRFAIKRRQELKTETKSAASWIGSITKEEIKSIMLSAYSNEYIDAEYPSVKLKMINNQLGSLTKILEDRGSQIQTILRRRTGLQRNT